jgi:glycosyltransferase involved in cell wall biosynthesis
MKILISADPFLPVPPTLYGGIERIIAGLVVALRQNGHQVGLLAHPASTAVTDYFLGWPEVAPASPFSHARNTRALLRAAAEFGPSLLHSFSRLLYLAPFLMRKMPKVMSYQRPTGGRQTRIGALLGGNSLTYTGCSEFIAAMGRRHGGDWHAIPNFVDVGFYRFSPTVAADAPLLFLSRIESSKGAHVAIAAAKKAGRRLLLAGNHAETGPERDYWETQIRPALGKNGIEYVGPVDDAAKNELLGSAAAMIVPVQWDEPFGIVFAEALACGTPVISCPRGALPEIVRHRMDGFLVPDVEGAVDAIRDIVSIDRAQCRRHVERCFSVSTVVPRYEALYAAALGDR